MVVLCCFFLSVNWSEKSSVNILLNFWTKAFCFEQNERSYGFGITWASVNDDKSHLKGNCPFNNMRFGGNLRNLEWIFSPYQKECGNFTSYELLYGGRIFWEDEYISVKESSTQQMCVCVCVNDLFLYTVLRYEPLQCVCVWRLYSLHVSSRH